MTLRGKRSAQIPAIVGESMTAYIPGWIYSRGNGSFVEVKML